jgi:hypothetical protein
MVSSWDGMEFTNLQFKEPDEDDQNDLLTHGLDFDVEQVTKSYLKRQWRIFAINVPTERWKWQAGEDAWWAPAEMEIYIFYQPSVHDPDAGGTRHYYDPADGRIHAFTNSIDGLCHPIDGQILIPKEEVSNRGLLFIPFLYGNVYDPEEVFDRDRKK